MRACIRWFRVHSVHTPKQIAAALSFNLIAVKTNTKEMAAASSDTALTASFACSRGFRIDELISSTIHCSLFLCPPLSLSLSSFVPFDLPDRIHPRWKKTSTCRACSVCSYRSCYVNLVKRDSDDTFMESDRKGELINLEPCGFSCSADTDVTRVRCGKAWPCKKGLSWICIWISAE